MQGGNANINEERAAPYGAFFIASVSTRKIEALRNDHERSIIMNETLKVKRASGGTGWADAMFRYQADSASYAKEIIKRVIRKCNMELEELRIYISDTGFVLIKEKEIILNMSYQMVEAFRCEGVFAFDAYIENQLKIRQPQS